jgi:hypothetical protein
MARPRKEQREAEAVRTANDVRAEMQAAPVYLNGDAVNAAIAEAMVDELIGAMHPPPSQPRLAELIDADFRAVPGVVSSLSHVDINLLLRMQQRAAEMRADLIAFKGQASPALAARIALLIGLL